MAKRKFATDVDLNEVLDNKYSKSTAYADRINEKSFREFTGLNTQKELEELSKPEINELLCKYFTEVRKTDGEKYQKQSLDGIKFSLNRVFTRIFGAGTCDITSDKDFAEFRNTYFAYVKGLKSEGKHEVTHFDRIPNDVLRKIITDLRQDTPVQLQLLTWIYLMIYFCRRGQENICNMTKETFGIRTNDQNRRYLVQLIDEETKNHKATSEKSIGGRMYEEIGNPLCPVAIYEKYISHLNPNCARLFQRAKDSFTIDEPIWYQNRPIGKNMIAKFMETACRICKVTTHYTNHCLRVTSVNMMKGHFSDKDIMSISGHTAVSSLKLYERTTEQDKENISNHFSKVLTSTRPDEHNDETQRLQHENLQNDSLFDGMDEILMNAANEVDHRRTDQTFSVTFAPVFHNCTNVTINFSR